MVELVEVPVVPMSGVFVATTLAVAIFSGVAGYTQGAKSVRAEWDAERALIAGAQDKQRAEALARERTLQANADRLRKEVIHEKTRLAAVQRELADSLHDRADRPSGSSVSPSAGDRDTAPGCTGAELYRTDAQFLIGLATRADAIRLQLATCQAAYGEAIKDAPQ